MRVRLRAERRVERERQQRTHRDETEVETRALEHVPDSEDRAEREPEQHLTSVQRGVHQCVGLRVLRAGHVLQVDDAVRP